jgi:hydrogenase nickel incorporation protein HypA/HybF
MHELSICQSLLNQVEAVARREGAARVDLIRLRIGPLAGVVPELLGHAFEIARAGTLAAAAELITEEQPIRVRCTQCGAETDADINRLLCGQCGDYRTQLLSGDELLLVSLELTLAEPPSPPLGEPTNPEGTAPCATAVDVT